MTSDLVALHPNWVTSLSHISDFSDFLNTPPKKFTQVKGVARPVAK